jgi:protein-disulfide isomerase
MASNNRGSRAAVAFVLAAAFHPAATAEAPLFQLEGLHYGSKDLPAHVRQGLFDAELQHYRAQRRLAEDGAVALYLEREAERQGQSMDALRAELLPVAEPSAEEVEAFYNGNRYRIPYPLEQVREQIAGLLREQATVAHQTALLDELQGRGALRMLIAQPQPPQVQIDTAGRPSKGSAEAPVTLVEFADFQCSHCKDASPVVDAMLARYGDRLRVVYMDFPINPSGIAQRVSEGGVCAAQQQRFWDYHDLAFRKQTGLNAGSPLALAEELGLDGEQFKACLDDPATAETVARSKVEGERIGVDATPTFYVNGRRAVLEDLVGGLRAAIEAALASEAGGGGNRGG